MEVKGICQGGQNTLDYFTNQIQNNNATGDTALSNYAKSSVNDAHRSNDKSGVTNIDEKQIKNAVDKINKLIEDSSTHVVYESSDTFKQDIIIKIIDNTTNEVVREIPPRKLIDMVAKLCELAGVFINQKA